ncbi:hypothetical protein [Embleya sp. MST-111070]|uniref:hypothetical protein n=1 Tax=Embleya sp. MST-111070 TaxID=3398231 RepID=UPI003F733D0A
MDLTPYVDNLRRELAIAAAAGGPQARDVAERLTAPLESAARLTLMNALSAAMAEVTSELAPGSVDIRLRGLDPEFVVTTPPPQEAYAAPEADKPAPKTAAMAPLTAPDGDEGGMARINFRLPAHLKARVEETAGLAGLSVNAWLVRAVAGAMEPDIPRTPAPGPGPHRHRGRQGYTGWAR